MKVIWNGGDTSVTTNGEEMECRGIKFYGNSLYLLIKIEDYYAYFPAWSFTIPVSAQKELHDLIKPRLLSEVVAFKLDHMKE